MDIFEFLNIDPKSRKPKYQQIVDSIINQIAIGHLKMDQRLPSINSLSEEFYLSRDTVEKAYNILKEQKVISSIRGKGYYVTRTKLISKINVLFLINKLSSYKLRIYNSFVMGLSGDGHTDLHIYHCDESLFLNLMEKNLGAYDYYVIMPHFKTKDLSHVSYTDDVLKAIRKIPKNKLVIMDNNKLEFEGDVIEIYQDFENDIYEALKKGIEKISKYGKLILVYPENTIYPYPKRILFGFRKFCVEHHLEFEIINEIFDDIIIKKGDLFITIEESDLVNLMKQIRDDDLILGVEVGVISYNDTPLKDLLGITVISTDFKEMGRKASEMILNNEKGKIKNPFHFIDRNSV
ncbi:GntR family transcriptional regulator [Winogradskyella forsetii]|uniref:GntR family transcriptional regulator n=1 Tax=Winogradskyella forsetii TaxID=2686077 RepID=UPI0015C140D7|nr:GntR family transcriptional regulator [Winogradskyella forsetii]